MMGEPILSAEDIRIWDMWQRAALAHSTTRLHRKRVDTARAIVDNAVARVPELCVMWSGGKDSTAMTHLACVDAGHRLRVYSEKDDLDYPGERDYVEGLGSAWGIGLRVLEPAASPREWVIANAARLSPEGDVHSRSAELSELFFYSVVEAASRAHGGIMLGLRAGESKGRRLNRAKRGTMYRKADGQWVCQPIADWSGLDVMAYMAARGIEALPVYRCVGFDREHAAEPWRIRKSWWLPGLGARTGQVAWLRHYWPSLYAALRRWMPGATRLT